MRSLIHNSNENGRILHYHFNQYAKEKGIPPAIVIEAIIGLGITGIVTAALVKLINLFSSRKKCY